MSDPPAKRCRHTSTPSSEHADGEFVLEVPRHPYGVRPLGSRMVEGAAATTKGSGEWDVGESLGDFSLLFDAPLLHVLKVVAAFEGAHGLAMLAQCSKALYILTSHSPLWRPIVLRRFAGDFQYTSNWKHTYITEAAAAAATAAAAGGGSIGGGGGGSGTSGRGGRRAALALQPSKVLNGVVLHSDLLYQTWSNSACSISPSWLSTENIDRRSGQEMTVEEFRRLYDSDGVGGGNPVIITDVIKTWPAYPHCSRDGTTATPMAASQQKQQQQQQQQQPVFKVAMVEMKLEDYFQYSSNVQDDERPLYLFDKQFAEKLGELGGGGYCVPEYFVQDMFGLVGEAARPDYRWLIAGPARSGSSFHVDPNGTSAWNALLVGRKKWIMYPPDALPPGVSMDGAGGLSTPTSLVQWFRDHYNDAKQSACPPLEGVCHPGEIMFVPSGWWHCVFNIDETIAITHNVVTEKNLLHVLKLLHEPAMCSSPEACKGSDGDVPLWVAMGGVVEANSAGASGEASAIVAAPHAAATESATAGARGGADSVDASVAVAGMTAAGASKAAVFEGAPRLCHCAKVKSTLLQSFEAAVEEKYPDKISTLKAEKEAQRMRETSLWDRLTERQQQHADQQQDNLTDEAVEASTFSFGF
eukprot:gene6423-28622_t